MFIPLQRFTTYAEWAAYATLRGYSGPHRRQGRDRFEFVGNRGQMMASWDGTTDVGIVLGDEAPSDGKAA